MTGVLDSDAMSGTSAALLSTSESIKAYVDSSSKAAGISMTWETATGDSDQGVGKVWASASSFTPGSDYTLYFDDVERNSVSINALIDSLDDPTATNSATIYIQEAGSATAGLVFLVNGSVTSASTYSKIAVEHVATFGSLSDGDVVGVTIAFSGNNGSGEEGTVTQINAGDGFSFSAITSTGTIAVDGVLQDLDALGAPASDGQFIVATGSGAFNYESGATAFSSIKQDASTSATGVSELATTAETITGTDTARVITPAGLHGALAGLTDTTIVAGDAIIFSDASDSGAMKEDTVQGIIDLAGGALQTVSATIDAVSITVNTPAADTSIPLISEGTEIVSVAITPTSSSNLVRVDMSCTAGTNHSSATKIFTLFRDSVAIAASLWDGSMYGSHPNFCVVDSPATTSETTYSVRGGISLSGYTLYVGRVESTGVTLGGALMTKHALILSEIEP